MKRIVWTFGLIGGAIVAATELVIAFSGKVDFDNGAVIGYTSMILSFLMVFFGVRSYRENVLTGTIRFGRAFKVGLLIALVISFCYVGAWEVVMHTTAQDFGAKYAESVVKKAQASGAPAAEIAKTKATMEKFVENYKNPVIRVGYTFIEVFPLGFVAVLVSAGILSRKKNPNGLNPAMPAST